MARGVTIREQALGAAPVAALNISTVGIVGTAPDAEGDFIDADGNIIYDEPFLITKRSDGTDLGDEGTLPLALDSIYAQGGAVVAVSIIEHTDDATSESAISDVGSEFYADSTDLASDGDFTIGLVSGQLSITFYSLTGNNLVNVQNSARGRLFTLGTGGSAPIYSIVGNYVTASKRIPVKLESGTTPTADATLDLALAAQTAVVGKDEMRTAATGDADEFTGVYALLNAESAVGRKARLIGAPGLDTGSRPSAAKNPLASALEIVATRLRGIAYLDGPNTDHAAALEYADDFNGARTYILDPGVMVTNSDGNLIDAPTSGFALGLTVKTDSDDGWWNSPSNRPLLGVQKLKRPIDYTPGDASSRAVLLNENAIATIIRYQGGFRLFGNRTPASTDPAFKFMSIRRIADNIQDSVQDAMFYFVDKNINKNFLRAVVGRANGFLRNMIAQGALIGAECFIDGELNTKENIALGKVYFNVRFTPPYPAEEIVFTFNLVNDYLTSISI